jgi:hypothetical protein
MVSYEYPNGRNREVEGGGDKPNRDIDPSVETLESVITRN